MTAAAPAPDDLRPLVEATLTLLENRFDDVVPTAYSAAPTLPDLLVQCQQRLAMIGAIPVPLRAIYHFACTGGTLISKCLGAMPNAVVLSEIDPLSTMHLQRADARFLPTDIIAGLRTGLRDMPQDTIVRVFQNGIETLLADLTTQGRVLVLRGHPHSHFCTGQQADARPTLHEMLRTVAPTHAVVTVRHPLDSFLSLQVNGWNSFEPFTLNEYARRYLAFLDAHGDLPIYKYEAFLDAPQAVIAEICGVLDLRYWAGFEDALPLMKLSGDSGRRGLSISPRPRREIPREVESARSASSEYQALCARLEYPE